MLEEGKRYTLSDLAKVIKESTNEYKPKIDPKVIKTDAQNNVKAVKDIMRETGKINDGGTIGTRHTNPEVENDLNKTTLDYDFAVEPSKEYKDRVKAQAEGFASVENKKNSKVEEDNESLYFDGNKEFYDNVSKRHKEVSDAESKEKRAGLKARELPKELYDNNSIFTNEDKKMKRLHFSHTVFLNEEQMLKRIPDDYKKDGNRFLMKDSAGTEYLVECKAYPGIDYIYTNVVRKTNKTQFNEQLERIKSLTDYTSKSYNTGSSTESRLNEDKDFGKYLGKTKSLSEKRK